MIIGSVTSQLAFYCVFIYSRFKMSVDFLSTNCQNYICYFQKSPC